MKLIAKKNVKAKTVLTPLMQQLVEADRKLKEFQAKNEKVFTSFDSLKEARDVLENQLRTESKRLGDGYEDEDVAVEYVMPMHRYYDPVVLEDSVDKKILDSLGVIETKKLVNERMLKMLVKAGKVKKSVMQKAYREEPTGSPRVTITIKKKE